MTAVLLAGGKSIRVMPSAVRLPKALMPVGALTVVEVLLHQLRSAGIRHVVICTARHGDLIEAVVGDGARFEMEITYERDPADGTSEAGALDAVRRLQSTLPERFLLMHAGTQCTIDFGEFFEVAAVRNAAVTVAVHEEHYRSRYGVAKLDASGRVAGFAEKPLTTQWVDMGIYVCHRRAFDLVPATEANTIGDLLTALVKRREPVIGHRFSATWLDRDDERAGQGVSLGATARFSTPDASGTGLVSDLSLHGTLLVTEVMLPVEALVTLEWPLPGRSAPVKAQGVVTGVTGDPTSTVAIGIRFTRVLEADHAAIEEYLSAMHAEVQ